MNERELLVLAYHIAKQVGNGDIDVALNTATKIKLKEIKGHRQTCQYIITRVLGAVKTAHRRRKISVSIYNIAEPTVMDPLPEFEILDGLTAVESNVARRLIAGDTTAEISKKLQISIHEVRETKKQLKKKLGG